MCQKPFILHRKISNPISDERVNKGKAPRKRSAHQGYKKYTFFN
jgi:hypothetical protein